MGKSLNAAFKSQTVFEPVRIWQEQIYSENFFKTIEPSRTILFNEYSSRFVLRIFSKSFMSCGSSPEAHTESPPMHWMLHWNSFSVCSVNDGV